MPWFCWRSSRCCSIYGISAVKRGCKPEFARPPRAQFIANALPVAPVKQPTALRDLLDYCLKTMGGPLTRSAFKSTVTSTRSAILMKGMPLFIPNSLRSNAIVPVTSPWPVPFPVRFKFSVSGLETPRIVKVPGMSKV